MEPTYPIWDPNLGPKTGGKSMVLGGQEPTYVARAENVEICTTLKRKPCFCSPRAFKKPSKIDEKSILRAFYVEVFFQHPKKSLPEPSRGPLGDFLLQKSKILDPQNGPKKCTIAGVVASCALFKTLLDLLGSYGFVLGIFWKRSWCHVK